MRGRLGGGCADDWVVDARTTLRAAAGDLPGRHTLGGLGQRCGELIANCD